MANLTWNDIENGEEGLSVRTKINNFNNAAAQSINNSDIGTITDNVAQNTNDISTNSYLLSNVSSDTLTNTNRIDSNVNQINNNITNIQTNTNNIATNTGDITGLDTRVTTNETQLATNTNNISTNTGDITALDNRVSTNETNISNLETNTTNNTSNISTNTNDIATNTSNIATNTDWITKRYFDYNSITTTINNVSNTYENLLTFNTGVALEPGLFIISLNMIYDFNLTTSSVFFRFSLDGGNTWTEVSKEGKDSSDKIPFSYSFVYGLVVNSTIDVIIQGRKETTYGTLDINNLDLYVERKI